MPWRRTPGWVSLGGAALATTAGFVNAFGFLSAEHHGITHVTGQVTQVGIEAATGNLASAGRAALLIVWFFAGAVVSGMIVRSSELSRTGRRYAVAMLCEAGLLLAALWLLGVDDARAFDLLAMSAGLQNALATTYSGAIVRTTHMTGIVTDLGIMVGHALRREKFDPRKLGLLALLFASFVFGGTLGAAVLPLFGKFALLGPVGVLLSAATAFLVLAHLRPPTADEQHPTTSKQA